METAAISFLDILGFKGIWQNRDSNDVLEILSGVSERVINTYKEPKAESGWPKSELPEITILVAVYPLPSFPAVFCLGDNRVTTRRGFATTSPSSPGCD